MLTVVAAAAIGRSCLAGNKVDVESGAIVVAEYSIIEPGIRVAIEDPPWRDYCSYINMYHIQLGDHLTVRASFSSCE